MSISDEIRSSFKQGGVLTKLIYINLGVFLTMRILYILFTLFQVGLPVLEWLSVPADPLALLYKPWTLISYMFLHYDFLHILFNMLYLFWFGRIFLQYFNPRQLLGVYFMGGIAGAGLYILSYNFFPALSSYSPSTIMMGASASVMAILFSAARYAPNFRIHLIFLGPIKLIHVALGLLVLDLMSISALNNTGGHLAHIGGALFGYFYISQITKGRDITLRFNRFMDSLVTLFTPRPNMKVTHNMGRPMSDGDYNINKRREQQAVDQILEKIKKSGYDSLTKDEKNTLFRASNQN